MLGAMTRRQATWRSRLIATSKDHSILPLSMAPTICPCPWAFHLATRLGPSIFPPVVLFCTFPENPQVNSGRPLTKSRHLTCVAGNYLSLGPSGRRLGNYSSELSGQSEFPFGRRQTVQRAGGLPRRSSPGPAGPAHLSASKIRCSTTPCPIAAGSVFSGKVQIIGRTTRDGPGDHEQRGDEGRESKERTHR